MIFVKTLSTNKVTLWDAGVRTSTHGFLGGAIQPFSQSVQSLSHVRLFATPWIAAHQASLSITNSQSSLRCTSIESVMPSSHLILSCPLLLLPPIPPSIRVFSNESTLHMRWPKYWSFSFSIIPSKEIPGLIYHKTNQEISVHLNFKISNVKKGELRYKNFPWWAQTGRKR